MGLKEAIEAAKAGADKYRQAAPKADIEALMDYAADGTQPAKKAVGRLRYAHHLRGKALEITPEGWAAIEAHARAILDEEPDTE